MKPNRIEHRCQPLDLTREPERFAPRAFRSIQQELSELERLQRREGRMLTALFVIMAGVLGMLMWAVALEMMR